LWSGRDTTNKIIKYYSYLFSFPSYEVLIAVVAILPLVAGAFGYALLYGISGLLRGAAFGFLGISAPLLLVDLFTLLVLRGDDYMSPRRVAILSYSSSLVLVAFILTSSAIIKLTGFEMLFDRSIVFAIGLNTFSRNLIVAVFSNKSAITKFIVTFIQPAALFSSVYVLIPLSGMVLFLGVLGLAIMVASSGLILWALGRWEDKHRSLRLLPLFRSFILAWADKVSGPLEEQITKMGEVRDLQVDSIIFRGVGGSFCSGLIVPYIHPGPFRDVGSSSMPMVLSKNLGERLGGEVLVAHGISTHELDMTKSSEIGKIVDFVYSGLPLGTISRTSTDVVSVKLDGAQVHCQMFGRVVLLAMTLSPKSYDDLPEELGRRIRDKAGDMGLTAVIIDSHNSIQMDDDLQSADIDRLYNAAVEAMTQAGSMEQRIFSVGVSRIVPDEWMLEDGMGPCGIAALVVKPENGNAFAYVVLDGNNMISGVRESILSELKSRESIEAELLTSDTHMVNAIGATTRGYYPLGERTEKERLIEYVVRSTEEASSKMTECSASHSSMVIPELTVLGENGLNLISEVLESAFNTFKNVAIVSVTSSLILAVATVFFL